MASQIFVLSKVTGKVSPSSTLISEKLIQPRDVVPLLKAAERKAKIDKMISDGSAAINYILSQSPKKFNIERTPFIASPNYVYLIYVYKSYWHLIVYKNTSNLRVIRYWSEMSNLFDNKLSVINDAYISQNLETWVAPDPNKWLAKFCVPSHTYKNTEYTVTKHKDDRWSCTCKAYTYSPEHTCKHIEECQENYE